MAKPFRPTAWPVFWGECGRLNLTIQISYSNFQPLGVQAVNCELSDEMAKNFAVKIQDRGLLPDM